MCLCLFQMLYSQAGQLEYDEVVDFTRARSSLSAQLSSIHCHLALYWIGCTCFNLIIVYWKTEIHALFTVASSIANVWNFYKQKCVKWFCLPFNFNCRRLCHHRNRRRSWSSWSSSLDLKRGPFSLVFFLTHFPNWEKWNIFNNITISISNWFPSQPQH